MDTDQKNPYVGPRTFLKEESHLFFGRDREGRDLSALVASDKLVLFYAQSGAGKSSLINTRLIPNLEGKLYEVLPVARGSGNWPEGDRTRNIYVYNLMRSLIRREVESDALLDLSLSQFLAKLNEDEEGYFYDSGLTTDIRKGGDFTPWRRALIIDQFEELFSTHPEAWEKREDFFIQLAQAMQDDPHLWVVLVMREDYIASLDPYAHLLPGGLRTRYYMQRLTRAAAIKAVKKPVEKLRPYEPGVAEKLVEDLSRIKVQELDGTPGIQSGQFIEPVQLQVVCYRLWENLPSGRSITEKDLLDLGDVDEALGKYYEGRVAAVAQAKNVKERLLRDWIQRKLIAPGGIRSMVMQETAKTSGGMSNNVIQALQSDLVRAEYRGGTIWYELTHDRLVGPILENNKKWFDENLSPLQRQAAIWNDQERNESWLLRDQALAEVEDWAKANPDELTSVETEFLEACREKQEQIKLNEQARSARRLRQFLLVTGVLLIVALFAAGVAARSSVDANNQANRANAASTQAFDNLLTATNAQAEALSQAETARAAQAEADQANATAQAGKDEALSGSLVAQADSVKNTNYPLALLLAIEAYERDDSLLTRTTLFHLLEFTPYKRYPGFAGPVSSVAVSPDGALIAVSSCSADQCRTGGIKLYDSNMEQIAELSASSHSFGTVYALAFGPDGNTLAAGGCVPDGCSINRGQITLWDVSDPQNPGLLDDTSGSNRPEFTHRDLVKTIAFSRNGDFLASGSYDTTIILWELTEEKRLSPVARFAGRGGHSSFVNSVVFSPDGNSLISAGDDRTILLWSLQQTAAPPQKLENSHAGPVNAVAFSPDDTKLASAGDDNIVLLWSWEATSGPTELNKLEGHTGYVKSIAFSKDGSLLASTGFDHEIILWDTSSGEQVGSPLSVHTGAINSLAFGTKQLEGKESLYLVSGSDDRSVILWDLSARQPLSHTLRFEDELPSTRNLTASNSQYRANVNNRNSQQIDIQSTDSPDFLTLDEFDSPVQYVWLDGQALLTMDQNQVETAQITRWNIDSAQWIVLACEAVDRNITPALWQEFLKILGDQSPKQPCVTEP